MNILILALEPWLNSCHLTPNIHIHTQLTLYGMIFIWSFSFESCLYLPEFQILGSVPWFLKPIFSSVSNFQMRPFDLLHSSILPDF